MSHNARAAGDRCPALRVISASWREMVGSFSLTTRRRGYVPFWIARFGTMAAATPADAGAPVLSCAFGPGLTLEAMLLEVCG